MLVEGIPRVKVTVVLVFVAFRASHNCVLYTHPDGNRQWVPRDIVPDLVLTQGAGYDIEAYREKPSPDLSIGGQECAGACIGAELEVSNSHGSSVTIKSGFC